MFITNYCGTVDCIIDSVYTYILYIIQFIYSVYTV